MNLIDLIILSFFNGRPFIYLFSATISRWHFSFTLKLYSLIGCTSFSLESDPIHGNREQKTCAVRSRNRISRVYDQTLSSIALVSKEIMYGFERAIDWCQISSFWWLWYNLQPLIARVSMETMNPKTENNWIKLLFMKITKPRQKTKCRALNALSIDVKIVDILMKIISFIGLGRRWPVDFFTKMNRRK